MSKKGINIKHKNMGIIKKNIWDKPLSSSDMNKIKGGTSPQLKGSEGVIIYIDGIPYLITKDGPIPI